MQRSMPERIRFQPSWGVRARRWSGRAMGRVERLGLRCLKAAGEAFVEGVIAYASSMHGFPNPLQFDARPAEPASGSGVDEPAEIMTSHYQEIDELITWLEQQGDLARDRMGAADVARDGWLTRARAETDRTW